MGPDFGALVKGYAKPRKIGFADQTNVVQFLFPVDFCANFGEDRFAELMASMFERLDCDSAYAAPALHFGIIGRYDEARTFIAPRALQHHGYDVPDNATTASGLGRKSRGARWLTALSSSMVDRVGGMKRLTKHIARGVEIRELKNGVLIRAGATPELGAVNRGQGTPLLASVAHAIEPITHFGDNAILPLFANKEQRDRWERRFWWNQD